MRWGFCLASTLLCSLFHPLINYTKPTQLWNVWLSISNIWQMCGKSFCKINILKPLAGKEIFGVVLSLWRSCYNLQWLLLATIPNKRCEKNPKASCCRLKVKSLISSRTMTGIEYEVLHVQDPILYVIRKQHRISQSQGREKELFFSTWSNQWVSKKPFEPFSSIYLLSQFYSILIYSITSDLHVVLIS